MSEHPRRLGLALVTAVAAGGAAIGSVAPSTAAETSTATPSRVASPAMTQTARGALAAPVKVDLAQPDGTKIAAIRRGDAARNWYESASGYALVQDASKTWRYATGIGADGQLVASGAKGAPATSKSAATGEGVPSGLSKGLRPTKDQQTPLPAPERTLGAIGNQPTMVILTQFSNRSLTTTPAQWNAKFFGASNSVRDFYLKASFNKLNITPAAESSGTANDGVVTVTIPQTHPDFRNNFGVARGSVWLAREALTRAGSVANFAAFDKNNDGYVDPFELHVTMIAAGYESSFDTDCGPSIWGHMSGLGTNAPVVDGKRMGAFGYTEFGERHCSRGGGIDRMATIGIMAHEIGHDLGWPDLYDIDQTSQGIGEWSLMASGSWGTTPGSTEYGNSPTYPDAWSKATQGWITPTRMGAPQTRSIPSAATSPTAFQGLANPNGFDWNWGDPPATGEYFLVENRTRTGYDVSLPGCGIMVYKVNESRPNNATDSNRLVDVLEADGKNDLDFTSRQNRGDQGDPFPGSTNNRILNAGTNPNTKLASGATTKVRMQVLSAGCANPASAILADADAPVVSASAGTYQAVTPARLLDTRSTKKMAPGASMNLQVTGRAGVPAVSAVDAVVVNVTSVAPTAQGWGTVWPSGTARPVVSNINYPAGPGALTNLSVVKVGASGGIALLNGSKGSTHFLVDVVGYYKKSGQTNGARYTPVVPKRVIDTRSGAPVGPNGEKLITVRGGTTGVPATATSVVMNLTAAETTATSYLTVYPNGSARPNAANLNWTGKIPARSNLVHATVGSNNQVKVFNRAGNTDLVADIVGWFGPTGEFIYHPVAPKRVVETRGTPAGPIGVPVAKSMGPGETLKVDLAGGTTGIPDNAAGVVVNTTVTQTTEQSYLTVWPDGSPRPVASSLNWAEYEGPNLNWAANTTVPNLVATKVGAGGLTNIFNSAGRTHVIMDLSGWYGR